MIHPRLVSLLALVSTVPAVFAACAGTPAARPVAPDTTTPPPETSASEPPASASASSAPAPSSALAGCGDKEIRDMNGKCVPAGCPEGQVLGSDGSCKARPPCLDGQELMGACLCPHGKSVDDTGHCAFTACPPGTGGTVFRNETTGDCMECRQGTVPCGDHCCPGAGKRSH